MWVQSMLLCRQVKRHNRYEKNSLWSVLKGDLPTRSFLAFQGKVLGVGWGGDQKRRTGFENSVKRRIKKGKNLLKKAYKIEGLKYRVPLIERGKSSIIFYQICLINMGMIFPQAGFDPPVTSDQYYYQTP